MHSATTAMVTVTATPAVMPTAGVGAEREAAEEDHRDDEDDTSHDPDPCGDRIQPAGPTQIPALVLVR
jgi:hypothetical protein